MRVPNIFVVGLLTLPLAAAEIDYPSLAQLYQWLHTNPELSYHEKETANRVAAELRSAGLEVTENVGGLGVVGVLKNGAGKTLMIRCDLDALPVQEQTGLPYGSKAKGRDDAGNEVSVMHACGHDVHMTSLIGTARSLAASKDKWSGTVVFIAQPAEERSGGARKMIADGLFTRFPKPDYVIALHVAADLPAGTIGHCEGPTTANVDSLDIVVRGVGGHGAWPHRTKDPIVLSAQIVLALQTIVSREIDPLESAVVTVGAIQGGSKRNIISDRVTMQLTLRSYSEEVRQKLIASIKRMCDGLGRAAGLPENLLPIVTEAEDPAYAIFNDPPLTRRLAKVFETALGKENTRSQKPVMGAEDFSEYGRTSEKIPICMFWLGAVKRSTYDESVRENKNLPSLHSPFFAPDPEPTIKAGVTATTAAALDLLKS